MDYSNAPIYVAMSHVAFLMLSYNFPQEQQDARSEFEAWLEQHQWQLMTVKSTYERLEVSDDVSDHFQQWLTKLEDKRKELGFNREQMPMALMVSTVDPEDI